MLGTVNQLQSISDLGTIVSSILLACLGILGIVLGVRWLEGVKRSPTSCLVFWAAQIPVLSSPNASYAFFCGADFNLDILLGQWGTTFTGPQLGITFIAQLDKASPTPFFGLNMVALAATLFFFRSRNQDTLEHFKSEEPQTCGRQSDEA